MKPQAQQRQKYHLMTLKSGTQRQPFHICSTCTSTSHSSQTRHSTEQVAEGNQGITHINFPWIIHILPLPYSALPADGCAQWQTTNFSPHMSEFDIKAVWALQVGQVGNCAAATAQAYRGNHVPSVAILVWRTPPCFHKRQLLPGVATELGNTRQDEEEGSLKMPAVEQLAHGIKAGTTGTQWKGHWTLCCQIHTTIKVTTVLSSPATSHRVHWFEQHLHYSGRWL